MMNFGGFSSNNVINIKKWFPSHINNFFPVPCEEGLFEMKKHSVMHYKKERKKRKKEIVQYVWFGPRRKRQQQQKEACMHKET